MRIKEIMANMPITLQTKKEIDEYYKNAMKDITKKEKATKVPKAPKAPKATKVPKAPKATKVPKAPKATKVPKAAISLPKNISVIENKPSKFAEDIAEMAEILRTNKELLKERRGNTYKRPIVLVKQSFCVEIIATAYRINKRLRESLHHM
jgi:hypothetical protein